MDNDPTVPDVALDMSEAEALKGQMRICAYSRIRGEVSECEIHIGLHSHA